MSGQQKSHTKGEWQSTTEGRPFRYIDIDGVRYCQWDHDRGPVVRTNRAEPRSIRDDSGSYPPEDYQNTYTLFPRDQPTNRTGEPRGNAVQNLSQRITNVNQVHTAQGRHATETHLRNASDRRPPTSSQTSANDQPGYPPGTREIVTRGDRTYYLDGNREVISGASARQQETRARHGQDTPASLTARLASMSTDSGSSEESERHRSSRNPSDQGASARATARDLQGSSRHASDPRNLSQSDDHDSQALSARPAMARHSSRGSVIIAQDERSQSRERPAVRQLQKDEDDDHESSTESAQVPRRHSLPQESAYGETNDPARGQVQRMVSDEGPVQRPAVHSSTRRLSMNQGSGLPTISESGDLKATKIVGDNKGRWEVMDDRYYVRKDAKNFFTPGRVFAMLWHENAGNEGTDLSEGRYYKGKFGQKIYSTIRRMVVVKQKHGHCTCVPIATYGKQGTLKAGLSDADIKAHAVIYMIGTSSAAAPGERIVKNPIAVRPAKEDQKLHPMSRINFDKIYTIEHNVRVMNVGKVADESMHNLSLYFFNTHFGP